MRQTLFYLPTHLFGLPLFGNGLLFWLILLLGVFYVVRALIGKGKDVKPSDAPFYALVTALGIFLVKYVGPRIAESGGFPIRGYGVFLTLAILLAALLTIRRGLKKWNYPTDTILTIIFVVAFFGLLGARLFYVVQYWRDVEGATFRETLINVLDITSGGLVVYGSILGGCVAIIAYLALKRLPILATLDLFAPSLALGIAIGRLGCLMNGCCFGGPCDMPWGIEFPPGSPAYVQQTNEGVISLYGLKLAPPKVETEEETTFFSLKGKHASLASEVPAPVIVESVDPGSAAEEVGIKPGDRICETGLAPKDWTSKDSKSNARTKIPRYRPQNNAQVFYFFLNIWNNDPNSDVLLVLQEPPKGESRQEMKTVVFHPTPTRAKPVHPTQIYSSLSSLLVCGLLLLIARFAKRDGVVAAGFFIFYPINRFCLETIRTDEESFFGTGLTISQCVSLALLTVGIIFLAYVLIAPPKRRLEGYFKTEVKPKESSDVETSTEKR